MICVRADASNGSGSSAEPDTALCLFPFLVAFPLAVLPCCLALAAASPISGHWGRFQEKMEHPLGARCFVLQCYTLVEHKEDVKKSIGNGPKQTTLR